MTIKGRYATKPVAGDAAAKPDLADYNLVFANSSAGKDSQALLDVLVELAERFGVPRKREISEKEPRGLTDAPRPASRRKGDERA